MMEFGVAAKAAETPEDEDVVEVPIEDKVYLARRPTAAQGALMVAAATGARDYGSTFDLIEGLIGTSGRKHIERLIWERRIDYKDLIGGGTESNPEHGLIDGIFAEFSERPTQPSSGSSSSRAPGGRKSTGRSPGRGSTRSASPSTDS